VIALVAGVLVSVRPHTDAVAPVGPAPSAGVQVSIPTSTWKSGDAGMAALLETSLTLRADGCLVAESGGDLIVWPAGYTAERYGPSFALVRDANGTVVAQTGVPLSLGGGEGAPATGPCLAPHSTHWNVNQDPPFVTDPSVHLGLVVVPNLIGEERATADIQIVVAGLATSAASPSAPATVTVRAQDPAAGTEVAPGSPVRLSFEAYTPPVTTGLRGAPMTTVSCDFAVSDEGRFVAITAPVARYVVCPPFVGTPVDPIEVRPGSGAAFARLDSALRLPDQTREIGTVCPAVGQLPVTVVAVTATGIWSVHQPGNGCGLRRAELTSALDLP
jgi:hypothetical protein